MNIKYNDGPPHDIVKNIESLSFVNFCDISKHFFIGRILSTNYSLSNFI